MNDELLKAIIGVGGGVLLTVVKQWIRTRLPEPHDVQAVLIRELEEQRALNAQLQERLTECEEQY